MQQLSLSLGVAVGATALHLTTQWSGGALTPATFVPAFLTVGLMACASSLPFWRLAADAGDEISGHIGSARPETRPETRHDAARNATVKTAALTDAAD
jgi:hypothetical protein